MNKLFACLALAFVAPLLGSLHAQDEQPSEQYEPPPPVGVDVDYFAPSQGKLSIGIGILSGPKISLSGSGNIPSGVNPGLDVGTSGITRTYNDGTVAVDPRVDSNGNKINSADGLTTSWSYNNASQLSSDGNVISMHAYSATINGDNPQSGQAGASGGYDLTYDRDFGWHLGKVKIDLIAGLGLNKISYSISANVSGTMTTLTDTYNVYAPVPSGLGNGLPALDANGNTAYNPAAGANGNGTGVIGGSLASQGTPYTAPVVTSADSNGNPVTTSGGSVNTGYALDSQPNNRGLVNGDPGDNNNPGGSEDQTQRDLTTSPAEVAEQWNVTGAYFTFRLGPQFTLPLTENFSANVSGGPALVYVGTTFSVDQTVTPPTGSPIESTATHSYNTVLPAYFANANIEYSLTDTTGLFVGAAFQASRSYNQSIVAPDADYTTRVDFGSQEGVNMGIDFKF